MQLNLRSESKYIAVIVGYSGVFFHRLRRPPKTNDVFITNNHFTDAYPQAPLNFPSHSAIYE